MIKMRIYNLENDIDFTEKYINILEIENNSIFSKTVYLINRIIKYSEESDEIILIEDNKRLTLNKEAMIIHDVFNIDINETKILKSLYIDIDKQYKQENYDMKIVEKFNDTIKSIDEIISSYDFEFEYKREVTIKDILKVVNLKLDNNYYDNPFDNIICLFELVSIFKLYKLIILVNIKCYFKEEELIEIYKAAKYRGINLLIIESIVDEKIKYLENKLSIDNDYDEFISKM